MSDEDDTRMLAICPQEVVRIGLVDFGERHDTRTLSVIGVVVTGRGVAEN